MIHDRPPDLIYFPPGPNALPRLLWYADHSAAQHQYRRCSNSQAEADEGRGKIIDTTKHTQPYTPDLWSACQEYIGFRDAYLKTLETMLSLLRRGIIPPLLNTTPKGDKQP